jgi:hypothetical protein
VVFHEDVVEFWPPIARLTLLLLRLLTEEAAGLLLRLAEEATTSGRLRGRAEGRAEAAERRRLGWRRVCPGSSSGMKAGMKTH